MTDKLARIARCCPEHSDWQVLAEHLCRDFSSVTREQVLRNVLDAQAVTERFNLAPREALDIGELIVRYRLLLSTGKVPDVARTDPQTHHVGGAPASEDAAERSEPSPSEDFPSRV
ncbi:MAG TPA: hypothetical protein VHC43_10390 [Mycobacteriales bacterium]|nr:hypothetical protein [Mycobacteriales bacterium]